MVRAFSAMAMLLVCLAAAAGCPNNGPGPVEPTGDDQPDPADVGAMPEAVEPPPPPPPSEYVGDPGTLIVKVTFNGAAIDSPIEIRRTGQPDVVESATLSGGTMEATFSLPPGRYDVRAGFPQAIDGAAEVKEAIRIQSGQDKTVEFTFDSMSQVTLECKRGGRNASGTIRLRRPGATDYLPEARCQEEFFITGGAWEAEVTIGGGRGGIQITTTLQIVGGGVIRTPIMIEAGGR
jgi:hypothetical protein